MSDYLSLTDLFLVGLALDVTGAALLARGLLIPPRQIIEVTAQLWGGNPHAAGDRASSRVDAEFGLTYLALGFVLQAAGYAIELHGGQSGTGTDRLIAALTMSVIAAGIALLIYRWLSPHRLASLLSDVIEAEEQRDAERERMQDAKRAEVKSEPDRQS